MKEICKVLATSIETRHATHLDIVNVVSVPGSAKEFVSKSQNENVFDHFLAQVMVNSEDLVLDPIRCKRALKLPRAGKVLSKRLLDLHK